MGVRERGGVGAVRAAKERVSERQWCVPTPLEKAVAAFTSTTCLFQDFVARHEAAVLEAVPAELHSRLHDHLHSQLQEGMRQPLQLPLSARGVDGDSGRRSLAGSDGGHDGSNGGHGGDGDGHGDGDGDGTVDARGSLRKGERAVAKKPRAACRSGAACKPRRTSDEIDSSAPRDASIHAVGDEDANPVDMEAAMAEVIAGPPRADKARSKRSAAKRARSAATKQRRAAASSALSPSRQEVYLAQYRDLVEGEARAHLEDAPPQPICAGSHSAQSGGALAEKVVNAAPLVVQPAQPAPHVQSARRGAMAAVAVEAGAEEPLEQAAVAAEKAHTEAGEMASGA
eukprot:6177203-Pleurochrysis_carterae.AAC.3